MKKSVDKIPFYRLGWNKVYFFLVGACVRIYKILQRNATFLLVTLFFYLH
jgi:hypothetical protein